MQMYLIGADVEPVYELERDSLLYPCMIIDLRKGETYIYETPDSEKKHIDSNKQIMSINQEINILKYNLFNTFGTVSPAAVSDNVLGTYAQIPDNNFDGSYNPNNDWDGTTGRKNNSEYIKNYGGMR